MKVIGRTSFTAEGYEKFVTLDKQEQIAIIADGLSPKDPEQAEKLLTRIPYGNISGGNEQEADKINTDDTARSGKNSAKRPATDKGESK